MEHGTAGTPAIGTITRTRDEREFGADLGHRRLYVSRLAENGVGINGNSWVVVSIPQLLFSPITFDGLPETVTAIGTGVDQVPFQKCRGGYRPLYSRQLSLACGGREWTVICKSGREWRFYGPETGKRSGLIKAWYGERGEMGLAKYDSRDRLAVVEQIAKGKMQRAWIEYEYFDDGPHRDRLRRVTKHLFSGRTESPLWRIHFTYYHERSEFGAQNDLRSVETEDFQCRRRAWSEPEITHYRYYTADRLPGFKHGLKFEIRPADFQRIRSRGLSPFELPDDQLAPYASSYFEYDHQRRAILASFDGGTRMRRFEHAESDLSPQRNWSRRSREIYAEGERIVYYNALNLPTLSISRVAGVVAIESWEYHQDGTAKRHLAGGFIRSVREPQSPSENFRVSRRTQT